MFGEQSGPCGHCDVCKGAVRLIDGRIEAQKALSAVLRTSGRFFFGHLANILSGKTTEAVERHGHDQLKTFGVGKDRTPADWRGVLRQLQSAKLIERDENDRERLVVTDEGRRVLRGETAFALREDVVNAKMRRSTRALVDSGDADAQLLAALKGLARRDCGGAEAAGLCHFSGSHADRNGEGAAGRARRAFRPARRRGGQAAEIWLSVPRGHPGPFACLSCRRSKPCGAASSRRCSARESKGRTAAGRHPVSLPEPIRASG